MAKVLIRFTRNGNKTPNPEIDMKKFLLVTLISLLAAGAHAQGVFNVFLTPEAAGGEGRTGTGFGTITLTGTTITLNDIAYSGLSGDQTVSHIHGPAAPGVGAGVLYDLGPYLTGTGSSGSFSGSFSLVDDANGRGFTVAQQLDQLNAGDWYVNVHSSTFGGGEIRGQITLVPEPSVVALAIVGGLALVIRRRSKVG